jgi:hypothetical protein
MLAVADAALRAADRAAFAVPARVVRRVIAQDLGLAGIGFSVPHRKSWVIALERAQRLMDPVELGIDGWDAVPASILLLARPDEDEVEHLTLDQMLLRYWRLLFHARIDLTLKSRVEFGDLSIPAVRARIDEIGQVEFDEAQAVLVREQMLVPDFTRSDVFAEFAAVFLELWYFSPKWLSDWFPSIESPEPILAMLRRDVDAEALFRTARLAGAPDPDDSGVLMTATDTSPMADAQTAGSARPERVVRRWLRSAERYASRGNAVRAARMFHAAREAASGDVREEAETGLRGAVGSLAVRLRGALGQQESDEAEWRSVLAALVPKAAEGFWNSDARLLYDLQKLCVDAEREVFVVDALVWMLSLGRRPLRRPLPHQREVLMSRHLRGAIRRLGRSRLSGEDRDLLTRLLHDASKSVEHASRERLRPVLGTALDRVELIPHGLPERVARRKVVEELLDLVVERGFFTMGQLRDTLSRSDLKLRDVANWRDVVVGDQLLRLNRVLDVELDGVYHPGEFYMRWLIGVSSLFFGTVVGRLLTLWVLLPFGAAFVILEGLNHIAHAVAKHVSEHQPNLMTRETLIGAGVVLLALIHSEHARRVAGRVLWSFLRVGHGLFIALPARLLKIAGVKAFLRSTPVLLFRRFLVTPMILTALAWIPLSSMEGVQAHRLMTVAATFVVFNVALNSRWGRVLEDATTEWFAWTWYTVRVRVFVALFEAVMDAFKRMLEWVERVLYAVDEWLRFRSGESAVSLWLKAVLGVFWSAIAFVIRFLVNLLIEPQINPIKHFPVVTVSHKIILPLQPMLAGLLTPTLGTAWGQSIATAVIFGCPGIFGFLVWELKENWRLYGANRPKRLQPVRVGHHGETILRLMKPGFHSGTLPKLYARLRKGHRLTDAARRQAKLTRNSEQLHHLEEAIERFVERDLLAVLAESPEWPHRNLAVGNVHLACNHVRVEILCPPLGSTALRVTLQEQAGWVVAGISGAGWIGRLNESERIVLEHALVGFYSKSGVDLVRERIEAALDHRPLPYDIAEGELVVWPGDRFEHEVSYAVQDSRHFWPRPASIANRFSLPRIDADEILFSRAPTSWEAWLEMWKPATSAADALARRNRLYLLPDTNRVPLSG